MRSGRAVLSATLGRRFALVSAVLALPLVASLVLASAYLESAIMHRRAVQGAAEEVAGVMLRDMFDFIMSRATGGVRTVFSQAYPRPLQDAVTAESWSPQSVLRRTSEARDSLASRGHPMPLAGLAVLDLGSGSVVVDAEGPDESSWLRRFSQANISDALPPERLFTAAMEGPEGAWFAYFMILPRPGRAPSLVVAVDVALDRLGPGLLQAAFDTVTAHHLGGIRGGVALRVTHPNGMTVFEQGDPSLGAEYRLGLFGPDLPSESSPGTSPFAAVLAIPPSTLPILIPGGMPGSPWPLAATSVIGALLLTGLALVLVWHLRSAMLEREAFVATVSHELRTPLAQILGYAETLQLGRPTPRANERAATVIVRETRRLIHLVENALHFVRGQRPEARLDMSSLDMAAVIEGIAGSLAELGTASDAALEIDAPRVPAVFADVTAMQQIILNLVDNAFRHGPLGQTVHLSLKTAGDYVQIRVDDQGAGVPPEDRERIWVPFVRGSTSVAGTGLGLAIVKQLVDLHGGRVRVTTEDGGVSSFQAEIPVETRRSSSVPERQDPKRGR